MEKSYILSGIKENCCGCSACVDICPIDCLKMEPDICGLKYPVKEISKCVHCGKCEQVCPMVQVQKDDTFFHSVNETYCAISQKAKESTSGGIFPSLAEVVLEEGGCVFGCEFTENLKVKHVMINNIKELTKIQGSKYLQSDLSNSYHLAKKQLLTGRKVLFSGTPCQIAALYSFLGKEYSNLITIDIFCHGVPSTAVFMKWITEIEKKTKGTISNIKFRPKYKFGWQHGISYTITKSNGKRIIRNELPGENPFYFLFLYGYIMRNSCEICPFSREERIGDISLGDCWSAEPKSGLTFNNMLKGVSFVMCNTPNGKELFKKANYDIVIPYPIKKESQHNSALKNKKLSKNITEEVLTNGIFNSYYYLITKKVLIKEKIKRILPQKIYFMLSKK